MHGKFEKDGTVTYDARIVNKAHNRDLDKKSIEIKSVREDIDNAILTNSIIDMMKKNDNQYEMSLKYILEDENTEKRAIYNIKKAIDCGLVTEQTKYKDYYAYITGFKDSKKLIKFCENAFKLMDADKKL